MQTPWALMPHTSSAPTLETLDCSATSNVYVGSQLAERLGNWASNLKVASSIPGSAKLSYVLGQGTSPYLPRENVPVLTVNRSGEARLLNV